METKELTMNNLHSFFVVVSLLAAIFVPQYLALYFSKPGKSESAY